MSRELAYHNILSALSFVICNNSLNTEEREYLIALRETITEMDPEFIDRVRSRLYLLRQLAGKER